MDSRTISIKAIGEPQDGAGRFAGVLSTYGNQDEVGDICDPGCYDASIAKRGTKRVLLWQHDWGDPIGSFTITDAEKALTVDGSFNMGVVKGREGYALLKRGDITGLSIGYTVDMCDYDPDGTRHLKQVDLWEGSLVTFPANVLATAEAKSMTTKQMRKSLAGMTFLKALTADERSAALAEIEAVLADYTDDPEDAPTDDEPMEDDPKACGDRRKKAGCDDGADDPELDVELGKTAGILLQMKEAIKQ